MLSSRSTCDLLVACEALEQGQYERIALLFNARISVNHNEVFKLLQQIQAAEDSYFRQQKIYGSAAELARTILAYTHYS
jgi:hypothetical protein